MIKSSSKKNIGDIFEYEGIQFSVTQKKLDGAFTGMKYNPQLVDWHGKVTQLPEKYKGHRLGHNWSISWVIDEIIREK